VRRLESNILSCLDYIIENADMLPTIESISKTDYVFISEDVELNPRESIYLDGQAVPYSLIILIQEPYEVSSKQ
jgi:hypothetical protein